jgi:hypothetical protein
VGVLGANGRVSKGVARLLTDLHRKRTFEIKF